MLLTTETTSRSPQSTSRRSGTTLRRHLCRRSSMRISFHRLSPTSVLVAATLNRPLKRVESNFLAFELRRCGCLHPHFGQRPESGRRRASGTPADRRTSGRRRRSWRAAHSGHECSPSSSRRGSWRRAPCFREACAIDDGLAQPRRAYDRRRFGVATAAGRNGLLLVRQRPSVGRWHRRVGHQAQERTRPRASCRRDAPLPGRRARSRPLTRSSVVLHAFSSSERAEGRVKLARGSHRHGACLG